jgi:hypothetical protein
MLGDWKFPLALSAVKAQADHHFVAAPDIQVVGYVTVMRFSIPDLHKTHIRAFALRLKDSLTVAALTDHWS